MQVEHRIQVAASPQRIFRLYEDVPGWPRWDPDTKSATLDGPFAVGTRGKLTPAKGNAVPMLVTSVEPNRSFTVECRIPLFRMVFEHELVPMGRTTEVVHRASFSGALAPFLGRMLARRVDAGLPVTLANLKRSAEQDE